MPIGTAGSRPQGLTNVKIFVIILLINNRKEK